MPGSACLLVCRKRKAGSEPGGVRGGEAGEQPRAGQEQAELCWGLRAAGLGEGCSAIVSGWSGPGMGAVLFADVLRGKRPLRGGQTVWGWRGKRVGRTRPWAQLPEGPEMASDHVYGRLTCRWEVFPH